MGLRSLPFFKAKKGWMFAGGGLSADGGGGGSLPIATTETLGAVRVGSGLNVANDGTLTTSIDMRKIEGACNNKTLNTILTGVTTIDGFFGGIRYIDANGDSRFVSFDYKFDSSDYVTLKIANGNFELSPNLYGSANNLHYVLYLINPIFSV